MDFLKLKYRQKVTCFLVNTQSLRFIRMTMSMCCEYVHMGHHKVVALQQLSVCFFLGLFPSGLMADSSVKHFFVLRSYLLHVLLHHTQIFPDNCTINTFLSTQSTSPMLLSFCPNLSTLNLSLMCAFLLLRFDSQFLSGYSAVFVNVSCLSI